MEHQSGKWGTEFTARPTSDKEANYKDDTFGDAFPLQFPYGFTGLSGDRAIIKLKERRKGINIFQKLLQPKPVIYQHNLYQDNY
jgi:hypothetical protein